MLMLAIMVGLTIGKPLGLISVSALAVWLRLAGKPNKYSWWQLIGAGALAGVFYYVAIHCGSGISYGRRVCTRQKIAYSLPRYCLPSSA